MRHIVHSCVCLGFENSFIPQLHACASHIPNALGLLSPACRAHRSKPSSLALKSTMRTRALSRPNFENRSSTWQGIQWQSDTGHRVKGTTAPPELLKGASTECALLVSGPAPARPSRPVCCPSVILGKHLVLSCFFCLGGRAVLAGVDSGRTVSYHISNPSCSGHQASNLSVPPLFLIYRSGIVC